MLNIMCTVACNLLGGCDEDTSDEDQQDEHNENVDWNKPVA